MDNTMEPELASEMVKLLARELKAVRAQLHEAERRTSITPCTGDPSNRMTHERAQALIAENDTLKAGNAALQERLAGLQKGFTHVSSIKSEEDLSNPLQHAEVPMSHASGEFARLLAENEDLIREKEEASRTREKLSILQEKYKRTKAKAHEYNEILNKFRVALSNCTQELEQSRKAVVSAIDFRDFLKDMPYEPVEGQLELSSIQPYARNKFHEDAMNLCKGPYFLHCDEVVWSPSGIALGFVVKPTFQYNPKIHGGAWTELKDNFDVGKQMDVCCFSGKTFRYLGTYERVGDQGITTLTSEALEYLDHEKLDHASKCTTLFPDLVPPSQTQMIENMYKQGVIKLQCFGIRCVAFNQTFAEKLREIWTFPLQQSLPDNTIINSTSAGTSGDVRKRKRYSKSATHSTRNKKRKH